MHTSQPFQGMNNAAFLYKQPKPNIKPWKHLALCTIVRPDCWKISDFWLLYKLIKLIKWILIFKDFNHPKNCWFFKLLWKKCEHLSRPKFWPIVHSIILVGKVTDQTLKIFGLRISFDIRSMKSDFEITNCIFLKRSLQFFSLSIQILSLMQIRQ